MKGSNLMEHSSEDFGLIEAERPVVVDQFGLAGFWRAQW